MCHLDYLTKCHEKYLVTWPSVGGGAQTFGGGLEPPQRPAGYGAGFNMGFSGNLACMIYKPIRTKRRNRFSKFCFYNFWRIFEILHLHLGRECNCVDGVCTD